METKICSKCKEGKTVDQFGNNKNSKDGLSFWCKGCCKSGQRKHYIENQERLKEKSRKYREEHLTISGPPKPTKAQLRKVTRDLKEQQRIETANKILETKVKTCIKCGLEKPLIEFNKHPNYLDGYKGDCKECEHDYKYIYYRQNREAVNKTISIYKKNNPNKYKIWRLNNKEHLRKSFRDWTKNNRDKKIAIDQRRKAKKQGNGGSFTSLEWANLKEKYKFTCLKCGKSEPGIKLTADHIFPLKLGGRNDISNLQPLCGPCNSGKHSRYQDYRPDSPKYGEGWKKPSLWG